MAVADMVLWVGISFEQSASTQYFRNVRPPEFSFEHLYIDQSSVLIFPKVRTLSASLQSSMVCTSHGWYRASGSGRLLLSSRSKDVQSHL